MAVGVSVGLILAFRRLSSGLMKGLEGTVKGSFLNSTVTCSAVAFTSSLNMFITRRKELETGVEVKNPKTNEILGNS
jgi:hypothetical protein